jgi:signal transduction histidine kinase
MSMNSPSETDRLETECRRLSEALALAERDRQLLGYEIHDGVVQDLTAAVMVLEGAGRQATFASPEGQDAFSGGLRLLHESLAEARRLIEGTITIDVDGQGIVAAFERLVRKFRAEHALPVTFVANLDAPILPHSVQHLLLRIAQEALYNAWKHARATEVEVQLAQTDEKLELVVADHGVGFDPASIAPGHYGLGGIRARTAVLGGELLLDTAPMHGTRIVVRLDSPAAT